MKKIPCSGRRACYTPDMENPISQLREHLGITQTELAKQLGYTPSRVSQVELGRWTASAAFTSRLWKRHGKALEWLDISPLMVLNWKRPV